MAITYPPDWYQQGFTPTNTYDGVRDIIWYMNGNGQSQSNTVTWTCVDCYDGSTREQPAGGDMLNLTGGNLWRPGAGGSLAVGHWCVLESTGNAHVVATFQVYCRCELFGPFSWSLMPFANFAAGGAATSTPTLPTAIMGQPPSPNFGDGRLPNASDRVYTILFDEGMMIIRSNNPTTTAQSWLYIGEVNSINPELLDDRPFVFKNTVTNNLRPSQADYYRISIADSVTIADCRIDGEAFNPMDATSTYADLGIEYVCKVNLWCILVGDQFQMGFLRNIGGCAKDIGVSSTLHTLGYTASDYRFEMWSLTEDDPKMVTLWPPGTALAAHTEISELSVPDTLIPSTSTPPTPTPPVVTYVNPAPGTSIRSNTAITITVTDADGFAGIQLRVQFNGAVPTRPTETIHGGDVLGNFEPFYQDCEVTAITGGFRFVLTRVNPDPAGSDTGWPYAPTFVATPIDSAGTGAL